MPIPQPTALQTEEEFLASCMIDPVMVADFPNEPQRYAICKDSWDSTRSERFARKVGHAE